MVLLFSISMLGHVFVGRTLESFSREFAFSQHLARVLPLFSLVVVSIVAAISASATICWLFIGILLITLKFFPEIFRFFLLQKLRRALIPLLDGVILGLQTGKSFRISLQQAIENQQGWIRHQFQEVFDSLSMSENVIGAKAALIKDFQLEVLQIDRANVRCLEQVRALRRRYKMHEEFRRRSGQLTQQIKMQAIIVTALFLALLIFVIAQFGFREHRFLIFTSTTIFFGGLLWIFFMGRRMKWKV